MRVARRKGEREQLLIACEIDGQWALTDVLRRLGGAPRVDIVMVYILDVRMLAHLVPAGLPRSCSEQVQPDDGLVVVRAGGHRSDRLR